MSSDSMWDDDWESLSDEEILEITSPVVEESEDVGPDVDPVDWTDISYNEGLSWHLDPRRFSKQCNPKMFHDGLPHEGPILMVDERLPAQLNHITDDDRVLDISKQLGYSDAHHIEFVVEVVMNDFSTIYVPFRDDDGLEYESFMARQVPKLKQWHAKVEDCDESDIQTEFDSLVQKYNEQADEYINSLSPDYEIKHGLENIDAQPKKEPEVKSLDIDVDNSSSDSDFSADDSDDGTEEDEDDYDWMDW